MSENVSWEMYTFVGLENFTSPVSPAELLIALHSVDPTKVDVKTIIKGTVEPLCLCYYFH